jgi:hypothetical protein
MEHRYPPVLFVAVYSVKYRSCGNPEVKSDYCQTEPREMRHLDPFVKNAGRELVCVFHISPLIKTDK